MSLNWDLRDIKDNDDLWVPTDEIDEDTGKPLVRLAHLTDTMIWMTMAVDMGSITEANCEEFAARVWVVERIDGPWMGKADEETGKIVDRPITLADVRRHIGLKTNVSKKTWPQFLKKFRSTAEDHIKRQVREAEKAA